MQRLLILLLVALAPSIVFAGNVQLTWTAPTKNTDNSPIPATGPDSLVSHRIEYGSCAGTAFGTKAGEVVVNMPALTTTIALPTGTYCFRAYAKNNSGIESDATNVVSKVVPAPTPLPPVFVTVAVVAGVDHVPVYGVLADGTRSAAVSGFVPVGVTCIGQKIFAYRGKDYRRVPFESVKWWATTPNYSVVAACG